jgi:O-antigen/teichoic acid export membrane protein
LLLGFALILALTLIAVLHLFQLDFALILVVGVITYCINFILYALFQKLEKYGILILLNSVMSVIKLVFAILIFLNLFQPSVTSAFGIFSWAVIPSLLLGVFLPKELKTFGLSFKHVKTFAKDAFPGGISQMVTESWSTIAGSLAKIIKDFSNVGIYSLADKLSAIFSLIAYSVFTVLLPQNAKRKQQAMKYNLTETLLISVLVLILAAVGCVVANIIVIPIFGAKFTASLPIIYILFFANALLAISSFTENYFFVEGKTNYLLPISLVKVGTFVVLAVIFTPIYSLIGLALSQLVASIFAIIIMTGLIVSMENRLAPNN